MTREEPLRTGAPAHLSGSEREVQRGERRSEARAVGYSDAPEERDRVERTPGAEKALPPAGVGRKAAKDRGKTPRSGVPPS